MTDEDGAFRLRFADGRPGVDRGRFHVTLDDLRVYANSRREQPANDEPPPHASRVQARYRTIAASPLGCSVPPAAMPIVLEVRSQ